MIGVKKVLELERAWSMQSEYTNLEERAWGVSGKV
jgi:hypothetical protein